MKIEVHEDDLVTPTHLYRLFVLTNQILVVASVNHVVGDWAVYIGIVKGIDHIDEMMEVVRHGDKITKFLGEYWFPSLMTFKWRVKDES